LANIYQQRRVESPNEAAYSTMKGASIVSPILEAGIVLDVIVAFVGV
jgi:hypothetical protein